MKRILCARLPSLGKPVALDEHEGHHLTRVFRLPEGAQVEALDGKGHSVVATLRLRGGQVYLEASGERTVSVEALPSSQTVPVRFEMAILKGDAMEFAIEKAVELGVTTLCPVMTDHTVVQVKAKGPEVFQGRWQKIADQALKQCGRLTALEILPPTPLDEVVASNPLSELVPRLWLEESIRERTPLLNEWLAARDPVPEGLTVLIGPEGGWSVAEKDLLARTAHTHPVSLGPLVLRAETAAIAAATACGLWFRARLK